MIKLLILLLLLQDYGWDSYPNGYTRQIFDNDMEQTAIVQAVPIAILRNNQKLPCLLSHTTQEGVMQFVNVADYTVKPAGAGTIEVVNSREFYFVPNSTYSGMGLVNVTALNTYGEAIIGQIHFIVRRAK